MRLLLLDWPSCGFAGYFMVASGGIMGGIEGWGGGGEFSGVGTKMGRTSANVHMEYIVCPQITRQRHKLFQSNNCVYSLFET